MDERKEKEGSFVFGAAAVAAVSLAFFAGCSTAGYNKSGAAAVSMQRAAAEVQAESNSLELTLTALKALFVEPGADLRRPYQHFSAAVDNLEAAAHRTEATGLKMAAQNKAYLSAWDKSLQTIDFGHIREVSETRKGEVSESFEAVNRRYQESQQAVQPLLSYLKDLRTALGNDLTSSGLESLKEVMQNADTNADKLQTALSALKDDLSASGARLSSLMPAKEPVAAQ